MNKQPITPARTEEIDYSLKKLTILSELLIMEYKMYLVDTRMKDCAVNNFASRIGKDATEIRKRLRSFVKLSDNDDAEEFVGQIWRVLDKLCNLDLEPLTDYADYISQELEKVLHLQ